MDLESQDNKDIYFQDNSEIYFVKKIPKNNIFFKCSNYLIIIFILCSLFLLIFTKRKESYTNKYRLNNEKIEEKHLDSNYERISPNDEKYIYIPIVGTNDFHGRFFPEENEIHFNSKKIKYKTGGLEYIAKYISILREEFGNNRVLYFDTGDKFFLKKETILFDGKNIQDFFNTIGLNGTVLGNLDFLYKRNWIGNKIKNSKYPYIINNIKDNITNKKNGGLGKNHETSHLYEIKLGNGDIIKIGVIGITLNNGVDKMFYNIGNRYTWKNLEFQSYETDLEKESNKLKEKGANAIILISHIGLICNNLSETAKINMFNKTIKQSECEHEGNSLLYKFLKKLKSGIIDAIVGGDTHNQVHHWLNDIPIMITKGRSYYLNVMYLPFKKDIKNNKYYLVNDEIKIEGPLPSCEKIFSNLNHCEKLKSEEEYKKAGELIIYYWHNKKIEKDIMTKKLFDKYYSLYKKFEEIKIVKFIGFNRNMKLKLTPDSLFGYLIMDAIRNITRTDVSLFNYFNSQISISPGSWSILDFIKLFPRENFLCTTEISGKDLITMIKIIQNEKGGFYPTSGLKQIIKINNKKEKQIIKIQIYINGKAVDIDKNKIYKLSSINLILFKENKSLKFIQDKYKKNGIKCSKNRLYEDLVNYFKKKKVIDLKKEIDMSKKRIVIIKN